MGATRLERVSRIDIFQDYLERMTTEHERLRVRCHAEDTSDAFLRIVECLDEALRQSIGQTGDIASLLLSIERVPDSQAASEAAGGKGNDDHD